MITMGLQLATEDGETLSEKIVTHIARYVLENEETSLTAWQFVKDNFTNISAWRSSTPDYKLWAVTICSENEQFHRAKVAIESFGGVEDQTLSGDQAWALIQRRYVPVITALAEGKQGRITETTHFGSRRGAILSSDGTFTLRRLDG